MLKAYFQLLIILIILIDIGVSSLSSTFLGNIRNYNCAFQFASMSAKLDPLMKSHGPYFFKICGQVYHYVYNTLKPQSGAKHKGGQLYILDSKDANHLRMSHDANKDGCLPEVFVLSFKTSKF